MQARMAIPINLREAPGVHSKLLYEIKSGEEVQYNPGSSLGRLVDGYDWIFVTVSGFGGWVALVLPEGQLFTTQTTITTPVPEIMMTEEQRTWLVEALEWMTNIVRNGTTQIHP